MVKLIYFNRPVVKMLVLIVVGAVVFTFSGCVSSPPRIQGVPSISPTAAVSWSPPVSRSQDSSKVSPAPSSIQQIKEDNHKMTLPEVLNLALNNNPATRAAWADARAAAARYGSAFGAWFPELNLNGNFYKTKGTNTNNPSAVNTEVIGTLSLSYLLFDFGGRSATVDEYKQTLFAANRSHDAVLRNTVLQAQVAFFSYSGALALLEANKTSVKESETNLAAAEERHRMGLATGADVLQAKTAYAQVKLALISTEGQVRKARGTLATVMGYPANASFEITTEIPEIPEGGLSQTVNQLIDEAVSLRPELQATRAQVQAAKDRIKESRSRMLPTLSAAASAGRYWIKNISGTHGSYSASLSLQVPIFSGFSKQYDLMQAKAAEEAAMERMRSTEQAVSLQVFSSHSDFLTACERVKTTNELLTSAIQSEEVAQGRYKEGVGNILDLLSAQQALASARAEHVNARIGWLVSLAQLAHDVGVLGLQGENPLIPQDISRR